MLSSVKSRQYLFYTTWEINMKGWDIFNGQSLQGFKVYANKTLQSVFGSICYKLKVDNKIQQSDWLEYQQICSKTWTQRETRDHI